MDDILLDDPIINRIRNIACALSFDVSIEELHSLYVDDGHMSEEEFFLAIKSAELLVKDEKEAKQSRPKPVFHRVDATLEVAKMIAAAADTEPELPVDEEDE